MSWLLIFASGSEIELPSIPHGRTYVRSGPLAFSGPRISAFYGIVITMYYADHSPPHFHARYGEFQAQIEISSGRILNGQLPNRAAH